MLSMFSAQAQERPLPLWEAGVFAGVASTPAYPGSTDRSQRSLALPFFIYRGEVLRRQTGRHHAPGPTPRTQFRAKDGTYVTALISGGLNPRNVKNLADIIQRAEELYPVLDPGAKWNVMEKRWTFTSGYKVDFAHLDGPNDHTGYNGQEITGIGIDQVEEI